MLAAWQAGRLDVNRFLQEQGITPDDFDEWVELNQVMPLGDEKLVWVMATGFAAMLNRMKAICESPFVGLKNVPDAKPKDFVFWEKKSQKKPKRKERRHASPNAMAQAFRAAFGGA